VKAFQTPCTHSVHLAHSGDIICFSSGYTVLVFAQDQIFSRNRGCVALKSLLSSCTLELCKLNYFIGLWKYGKVFGVLFLSLMKGRSSSN